MTPTQTPVQIPATRVFKPDGDDFDPDRYAHYCAKKDIARLKAGRGPITVICGAQLHVFRDPKDFPVCPKCKTLVGGLGQKN